MINKKYLIIFKKTQPKIEFYETFKLVLASHHICQGHA